MHTCDGQPRRWDSPGGKGSAYAFHPPRRAGPLSRRRQDLPRDASGARARSGILVVRRLFRTTPEACWRLTRKVRASDSQSPDLRPTRTVPSPSGSRRPRPPARRVTGCRTIPARAGRPCCASTAARALVRQVVEPATSNSSTLRHHPRPHYARRMIFRHAFAATTTSSDNERQRQQSSIQHQERSTPSCRGEPGHARDRADAPR